MIKLPPRAEKPEVFRKKNFEIFHQNGAMPIVLLSHCPVAIQSFLPLSYFPTVPMSYCLVVLLSCHLAYFVPFLYFCRHINSSSCEISSLFPKFLAPVAQAIGEGRGGWPGKPRHV